MKTELHYYDIFPKVFPAGKEIAVTIKPLGAHAEFENPEGIVLKIFGLDAENIVIKAKKAIELKNKLA